MASYIKFQPFVESLAEKKHDLGSDQLVIALSNSDPGTAASILTDVTEITYTNCSSRNITTTSSSQSLGVYRLKLTDLVLTASGGSFGPFRYIVIYNDTATNDDLVGYYDYGSSITIDDGETFTINFDDTNGVISIT